MKTILAFAAAALLAISFAPAAHAGDGEGCASKKSKETTAGTPAPTDGTASEG